MNNIDKQYQLLLQDVLNSGIRKSDRTGTGTISVFGRQIRHKMSEGFPLLTTKKMYWKGIVTELLWFLRGDTNIKYLVDNDCHIWDGDAYKRYCEYPLASIEDRGNPTRHLTKEEFIDKIKTDNDFAKKWGDLGPIYGSQWRSWRVGKGIETTVKTEDGETLYEAGSMYIDQIQKLINDLKNNPDSRRLMVNAWNVGELDQMVLPPCHYGFQTYTRELSGLDDPELYTKLDRLNIPKRAIALMWNQRSVDVFLGLPFNIASYALLLEIIAKEVNMIPDELIGSLGDTHLYTNHIEQAKEQIGREPYDLPKLTISDLVKWKEGDCLPSYSKTDFNIENYQSHPTIKAPLSN